MRAHIDADLIVYRAGFAAEKSEYYLEVGGEVKFFQYKKELDAYVDEHALTPAEYSVEKHKNLEPVENALYNVKSIVKTIEESVSPDDYFLYLSGPTNFRTDVATLKEYKGNRDPDHKPTHGPVIREYMLDKYPVLLSVDEEADDMVGYNHYGMWQQDPWSSIIVSIDKDLDMIPGLHFNWVQDTGYYVSEPLADITFWRQLLSGDSTDNIPGIPGIGKAKAEKALADAWMDGECKPDVAYEIARALYVQSYGDSADDALLENARLIWIRREPDELWTPPEVN